MYEWAEGLEGQKHRAASESFWSFRDGERTVPKGYGMEMGTKIRGMKALDGHQINLHHRIRRDLRRVARWGKFC